MQRNLLQKKNNSEVDISFVVSNPNTKEHGGGDKNQGFVRKVLGFFYAHWNVMVRVLACVFVVGAICFGIMDGVEIYKFMGGMKMNPIRPVLFKMLEMVSLTVKYFVPVMLVLLAMGVVIHKKITGKMPRILPTDVKISLGIGGVFALFLGGYFYKSFTTASLNKYLINTSIQVGVLVFLVMFFVLLALLNLCNIGKDVIVSDTKNIKKN